MGEPTFVNVLVKTEPNFPTPTRGTGTVAIFGYTPRVQAGYIGEEILISTTGNIAFTIATQDAVRTTGSWLIDGINVGDKVVVTGTTGVDGTYTVSAVTTDTLDFSEVVPADEADVQQAEVQIFAASSTVDPVDPAVAGEVKSFTNLFEIQQRYGSTSSICRSATEAIQNNVSMPIILMPVQAGDGTYDRASAGELYVAADTSIVLTNFPALPVTVYEGTTPLIEGYDASSSDFWVDVGNKTVHFHTARAAGGAVYYSAIQTADLTTPLGALLPKVANFVVGSYSMGQATIQDALFAHILAASSTTKKRIGIAANAKGDNATTITGSYANDRMVAIAHDSKRDINAMAAGVLSRLEPQTSLLLKAVAGDYSDDNFTDSDYETFITNQLVSLVNSEFVFGEQFRFSESFTLSSDGFKKYIDAMRVIDDVSFKVRATLSNPAILGTIKLATPQGMARLRSTITRLFQALVNGGEIDSYSVLIPGEEIVNKPPGQRTADEVATLQAMVTERKFRLVVDIKYSGAVHYLDPVELKFAGV